VLEYDVVNGVVTEHGADATTVEQASIFEVLDRALAERAIGAAERPARGLLGGFVGYIGYECKADCGSPNVHRSDVPDAVLMLANRMVAVDHATHRTDLLAVCAEGDAEAEGWLDHAEAVVRSCSQLRSQRRRTDTRSGSRPAARRLLGP